MNMASLRDILTSWCLSDQAVDFIEDQGFDIPTLKSCSNSELDPLVRSLLYADRIKFNRHFPLFQEDRVLLAEVCAEAEETLIELTSHEPGTSVVIEEDLESTPKKTKYSEKKVSPSPRRSPRIASQVATVYFSVAKKAQKKLFSVEKRTVEKRTISSAESLKSALETDLNGQGILRYYDEHRMLGKLNQCELARLIIRKELEETESLEKLIPKERFLELSSIIKTLFPSEDIDTFYIPSKTGQAGKQVTARGKLNDNYHNTRRHLKNIGVLTSKKVPKVSTEIDYDLSTIHATRLLGLLLSNCRKVKGNKGSWTPSRGDTLDGLLCIVKSTQQLQPKIESRKQNLAALSSRIH